MIKMGVGQQQKVDLLRLEAERVGILFVSSRLP